MQFNLRATSTYTGTRGILIEYHMPRRLDAHDDSKEVDPVDKAKGKAQSKGKCRGKGAD